MMRLILNFHPLLAAVLALVLYTNPLSAQTDDDQLAQWMSELAEADEASAVRLTREIERAWAQSGSTSLDMLLRRGRDALDEEKIDVAVEHFSALTDHAPDFAEGFHMRATAYFLKDLYGPAIADLQRTLALNPQHYNAIYGMGTIFAELGDYIRAEQAFLMVLDLHPHHERATRSLDALKRQGIGRTL